MTEVIRRKIDRARQPQADGAPGADRGWRLALARATRDAMGLDLEVRRLQVMRASLTEILDIAPERALVSLLDGPEGGLGVLMFAPPVTAAMIEMQTLGRLASQPAAPRKPTRIDAAMVAGVVDRALAGLDDTLAEEADRIWAGGFRYASFLEDMRPLALLLEEETYRVLLADVAMGEGAREGQVILVLPANGRGEQTSIPSAEAEAAPQFTMALAAQVMQVDCRLDAVIGRVTLPIRQIMALQPGDVLELPFSAIDAVTIETMDGRRVARARLGQNRGMRALKVLEADSFRAANAMPHRPAPVIEPASAPDLRAAS
jgi:flagellar motor switch protein FliM